VQQFVEGLLPSAMRAGLGGPWLQPLTQQFWEALSQQQLREAIDKIRHI